MAGQTHGATAPNSLSSSHQRAGNQAPQLVPAATRTRRNHGAFTLGGQLACIYSSRQAGKCYSVGFELGAGTLSLASTMTPAQARTMARALSTAADAAEAAGCGGAQ